MLGASVIDLFTSAITFCHFQRVIREILEKIREKWIWRTFWCVCVNINGGWEFSCDVTPPRLLLGPSRLISARFGELILKINFSFISHLGVKPLPYSKSLKNLSGWVECHFQLDWFLGPFNVLPPCYSEEIIVIVAQIDAYICCVWLWQTFPCQGGHPPPPPLPDPSPARSLHSLTNYFRRHGNIGSSTQ